MALAFLFVSCQGGHHSGPSTRSTVSLDADKPQTSWTPEQGYEHLLAVKCFAFGGVGFAGITSDGEFAFRAVLKSPDAAKLFASACAEATAEGKLYALCGLRATDPAAFNHGVVVLRKMDAKVMTMSGCIGSEEPIRTVVQRIVNGNYDGYFAKR